MNHPILHPTNKQTQIHLYQNACLHLLVQLQCLLIPRLAHQLIWKRFVNNKGKADTNVELDRENEHRNKAIKQECREFHGKSIWKLTNIPAKPLDDFYAVEDLLDRYVKTLVITATLDVFQMENAKTQLTVNVFRCCNSHRGNHL